MYYLSKMQFHSNLFGAKIIFFLVVFTFITVTPLNSQKPSVELDFRFEQGTDLYNLLMFNQAADFIDTIVYRGREQLIEVFNEYIAFLNFSADSSTHKLTINLLFNERLSVGANSSYLLQCTKSNHPNDTLIIPFLEPAEWISDLPSFEKKIYDKVASFLVGRHEQFLSTLPFNEIPITDKPLFNPIDIEWVLPFKVQDLSIDTTVTRFTIFVTTLNSSGQPTPKPYEAFYVGKYSNINPAETIYLEGIRTATLSQIDTSRIIQKHDVYIHKYRWRKFIAQNLHTDSEDIL